MLFPADILGFDRVNTGKSLISRDRKSTEESTVNSLSLKDTGWKSDDEVPAKSVTELDKDTYEDPFALSEKVRDEMPSALWVDNPTGDYLEVKFPSRRNSSKASRRSDSQAMILGEEEVIHSADFHDLYGTIEELDCRTSAMTSSDDYLDPLEVTCSRPSSALSTTSRDPVRGYANDRDRVYVNDRAKNGKSDCSRIYKNERAWIHANDEDIYDNDPEDIFNNDEEIYNNDPEEIYDNDKAEIDNNDNEDIYDNDAEEISNHGEDIYVDPLETPPKVCQNNEEEQPAYMTSVDNKPVHPYCNFKLKKSDIACSGEDDLYADLDEVVSRTDLSRPESQQSNRALLAGRESPAPSNLSRSSSRASPVLFPRLKKGAGSFRSKARK